MHRPFAPNVLPLALGFTAVHVALGVWAFTVWPPLALIAAALNVWMWASAPRA